MKRDEQGKHGGRKPGVAGSGRESAGPMDYGTYVLNRKETVLYSLLYVTVDLAISFLFYHFLPVCLLFLPGLPVFLKDRRRVLARKRQAVMQSQFFTGMQLVLTALQAGYSMENTFREALKELVKIYPKDAFIIQEFQHIVVQIGLNDTVENLLLDLGCRSHTEDIRNFAEVFYTARRSGGDLTAIIRNTISGIWQKEETRQEIETVLSGKQMEQRMMNVIPLFILAYVHLTSPGFMDSMYHNLPGILLMTGSLAVYLFAALWGRKIMHIVV